MTATARCLATGGVYQLAADLVTASEHDFVGIDTETAGSIEAIHAFGEKATFNPYAGSYLTGLSVCHAVQGSSDLVGNYVPVGHQRGNVAPEATQALLRALRDTRARHVFHHAVFDWPFLAQLGPFEPQPGTIDTQVTRWWQDENAPKGLKVMGELFVGEDAGAEKRALADAMHSPWENQTHAYRAVREAYPELPVGEARSLARRMRAGRGWHQLEVSELAPYAARDASLTIEVMDAILPCAREVPLPRGLSREFDLQHVLYGMTKRGVAVDIAQLDYAAELFGVRAATIRKQLEDETGLENPTSSKQCAKVLYKDLGLPVYLTTPGGEPATDKNALEMLQGHPVAAQILAYRKWEHARTAYADGFAKHARLSADNRIHGHYASDRTVTGRLSASGPNVMTIPRDDSLPEIAQAFRYTPPGVEQYRFDLASAELWVTASITQDPVLTQVLLDGQNLHQEMMVQVFGGERDKSRREYTLAKNVNFGIEYGAGLDQITIFAAKAGYGPREARRVAEVARDGHKALFAEQHRVAQYLSNQAKKRGKLPLHVPGRYRHFNTPGHRVAYYTALNALVQGGVAEFMKDTMLEIARRDYDELLVLQVHDELWFEGPPGIGAELHELLQSISHDINPFRYELTWAAK